MDVPPVGCGGSFNKAVLFRSVVWSLTNVLAVAIWSTIVFNLPVVNIFGYLLDFSTLALWLPLPLLGFFYVSKSYWNREIAFGDKRGGRKA